MNKKYIVLLLFIVFFLTGCTFDYNAKIMLDGTVKENVVDKTYVSEIYGEDASEVDRKVLEKVTKEYLNYSNTKANRIEYGIDNVTVNASKSYKNINYYINESKAIKNIFSNIKITKNNKNVLIESKESEYDFGIEKYYGDGENSTISISLPYKVINSNASEIDKKTNTYKWIVNKDFKGITLEYKENNLYTLNVLSIMKYATLSTYILIFAIIVIIVFVFFVILYYYRAIKLYRK